MVPVRCNCGKNLHLKVYRRLFWKVGLVLIVLSISSCFFTYYSYITRVFNAVHNIHMDQHVESYGAHAAAGQPCTMSSCLNYARCSLMSGFPVYLYDNADHAAHKVDVFIRESVSHSLQESAYFTRNSSIACVYVVLVGDVKGAGLDPAGLQTWLHQLPYWNDDGSNHVLLNLARSYDSRDIFSGVDTGHAMIVQSVFTESVYRSGFDIVAPPTLGISHGDTWEGLPPLTPAKRRLFISFQGGYWSADGAGLELGGGANGKSPTNQIHIPSKQHNANSTNKDEDRLSNQTETNEEHHAPNITTKPTMGMLLGQLVSNLGGYTINMSFTCSNGFVPGTSGEWRLCGRESDRGDLLQNSTFTLILAPTHTSLKSTLLTHVRLYEALRNGAIPVILADHVNLPFDELLPWKHVAIILPFPRITELHLVLQSFSDDDILEMRRRGRLFWETYLSTTDGVIQTTLATIRTRLQIPAAVISSEPTPNTSLPNPKTAPKVIKDRGLPSHRHTTMLSDWSNPASDPFHSCSFIPFKHVMSTATKDGSSQEQFTVVMLTYERHAQLMKMLLSLKGLARLDKIVVVWNELKPPPKNLTWPDVGRPIAVVHSSRNSLNNRFLPYDVIETEAVLTVDDDITISHDDITLGFRVWQENRDRLVGYPHRVHTWDKAKLIWKYKFEPSCQLSLILSGAAFIHKYYLYIYSRVMPSVIRKKVDEYMNCEDIALNFLVSHITRQPPIKVTDLTSLGLCRGCKKSISLDTSHIRERNDCVNYFTKVYGYMPLIFSQYRTERVLSGNKCK